MLRNYAAAVDPVDFRALLAADVKITMPPDPPILGIDAVAEFLGQARDWKSFRSAANGRPALINYQREEGSDVYRACVVDVLLVQNGRIVESNAFVGARHVVVFGMPETLP